MDDNQLQTDHGQHDPQPAPAATESKIEATDRLRAEGLWGEASVYRDEQRRRLRAEGMPRREAAKKAWELMLEKYPPVSDEELVQDIGYMSLCAIKHLHDLYPQESGPGLPDFRLVYSGWHTLSGSLAATFGETCIPDVKVMLAEAQAEARDDRERHYQHFAVARPVRFLLTVAQPSFEWMLGEMEAGRIADDDGLRREELRQYLDEMPWAVARCREIETELGRDSMVGYGAGDEGGEYDQTAAAAG